MYYSIVSNTNILTGSPDAEELNVQWLNENGMTSDWRNENFGSGSKNEWFKVPVSSRRKQTSKTKSVKKNSKTKNVNECVPGSLLMVFRYMGLQKNTKIFTNVLKRNFKFGKVVHRVTGFQRRHPNAGTFHPVTDTKPTKLYLCQISSVFTGNMKSKDNTHCISVFNNLIFDHNMKNPLPLTTFNLNKCCVGGPSYVFKHCSRVVEFTPTEQTQRFIHKTLFKKQ